MQNNQINWDVFFQILENNTLKLSGIQKNQFFSFHDFLLDWNKKINLIGRQEGNIISRHFLNSALIAFFVKFKKEQKVIDIGSGGGFPAIILNIIFPETHFTLVESIKKKSDFLKETSKVVGLKNLVVINERAEKIAKTKSFSSHYEFVTARAVSALDELIPLTSPFLKNEGRMLFLKGKQVDIEVESVKKSNWPDKYTLTIHRFQNIPFIPSDQESALVDIKFFLDR